MSDTTTTFFILSLKWTHQKDKFLCFWRADFSGYCWFKEWAGKYNADDVEGLESDFDLAIDSSLIDDYWIEFEYEGIKRFGIPNSEEIRDLIGIHENQLLAKQKNFSTDPIRIGLKNIDGSAKAVNNIAKQAFDKTSESKMVAGIKIGDTVLYRNTRSNIKQAVVETFEIVRNGDTWFKGSDSATGAKVYYPIHLSRYLMDGADWNYNQNPTINILELEADRLKWSLENFTEATPISSLRKLEGEIKEVEQDLINGKTNSLPEEYADCLMCLFDSAGRAGISPEVIFKSFGKKLEKNKSRTWFKNDDDTYSHKK